MVSAPAAVSAPADPTKVGYTFAGWGFVPETMPAAATTVTAQWANATQASYQVVYWGENLTGGYDYLYADKATGAVGGNIPYSTSLTASRMPQGLEAAGFEPEDSAVLVSEQEEGRFVPFFRIWSAPGVYCPRPRPHKAPEWTPENTLEVSLAPEYRIGTERFGERREFEKAIRIHLKSGRWARVVLSGELPEDPALLEAFCRLTDFYGSDLQYGELWRCARCAGTGVER